MVKQKCRVRQLFNVKLVVDLYRAALIRIFSGGLALPQGVHGAFEGYITIFDLNFYVSAINKRAPEKFVFDVFFDLLVSNYRRYAFQFRPVIHGAIQRPYIRRISQRTIPIQNGDAVLYVFYAGSARCDVFGL